ncbi:hypothetical protein [Parvibaculum sp.]|uniref:hypothetical protein n=1 Tax=Parvibaculum sp. TaxID=2024848 RepID=UPI0038B32CE3
MAAFAGREDDLDAIQWASTPEIEDRHEHSGTKSHPHHTFEVAHKYLVSMTKREINRISVKCRWGHVAD